MRKLTKILALLLIVVSFVSCKKEAPEYSFTVKAVLEDGTPITNVYIEASADVPNALPDFSGVTNEDGTITFTYEYEAVLKVRATRGSNPPTWMGCNFVKLEADKTVLVTVVISQFDPSQPGC